MKLFLLIILVVMTQIAQSSQKENLQVKNNNEETNIQEIDESHSITKYAEEKKISEVEEQRQKWANADIFEPNRLFQNFGQKQEAQNTKTYSLEDIFNIPTIKTNDMITQYLSNVELYFLKQISKCISNGVREEFINKREKEQKYKEQKLKEYFFSNFNAFIDYAHIEKASLDYLEIEIPEKSLFGLHASGTKGHNIFIHGPDLKDNYFKLEIMEDHPQFLRTEDFQFNNNESVELLNYCSCRSCGQVCSKVYKLNEIKTFKFKFHFRQGQKRGKDHHMTFLGQTFEFVDLSFSLRKSGDRRFNFEAKRMHNYDFQDNYKYGIRQYKSFPFSRVKMVEGTGVKFKFKFNASMDYYIFDAPKISNFDSSLSDTNFESLLQNCNFGQQSIFDHQFSDFSLIQQQGISFDQNTNSAQQVFPFYEEQFPFDQNFHLEQQQQQFSFDQNNNFGQQQEFLIDQNSNFGQQQFPSDQNNNFGPQQEFLFDQNSNFGQQQFPSNQNTNFGQQQFSFDQNNNFKKNTSNF